VSTSRSVSVAVVGSRVEAEMMVGMLRNHGVRAMVSADDVGATDPALAAQGVRVLVAAENAAAARRLLGSDSGEPASLNAFQRWIVRLLRRGEDSS
jgi:hypothetical protein